MSMDTILFWFLGLLVVTMALSVVLLSNPIYAALSLVMTMVGVAAVFVTLNAYFLAGVQLIVYTGAVMVLFVMVLMLFDLKDESQTFSRGKISGFLKIAGVGVLAGLLVGGITLATKKATLVAEGSVLAKQIAAQANDHVDNTKTLAENLFLKNILGFEVLGVLLLVIAIGTVALSRSKGGTHARD
jgi:NADH-quinone oxidoreductase subunit J